MEINQIPSQILWNTCANQSHLGTFFRTHLQMHQIVLPNLSEINLIPTKALGNQFKLSQILQNSNGNPSDSLWKFEIRLKINSIFNKNLQDSFGDDSNYNPWEFISKIVQFLTQSFESPSEISWILCQVFWIQF